MVDYSKWQLTGAEYIDNVESFFRQISYNGVEVISVIDGREPKLINHGEYSSGLIDSLEDLDPNHISFYPARVDDFKKGKVNLTENDFNNSLCCWVDIDHKDKQLMECDGFIDSVLTAVEDMQLSPSYYHVTGRGVHLYWVFGRPVSAKKCREFNVELAKMCALYMPPSARVDSVAQISKVMRVPGILNHKNGVRGALYRYSDYDYQTGQRKFETLINQSKDQAPKKPKSSQTYTDDSDDRDADIAQEIRDILPKIPTDLEYDDWQKASFAILNEGAGNGFYDQAVEIWADWNATLVRANEDPEKDYKLIVESHQRGQDRDREFKSSISTLYTLAGLTRPKQVIKKDRYQWLLDTAVRFNLPEHLTLKSGNERIDRDRTLYYFNHHLVRVNDIKFAVRLQSGFWRFTDYSTRDQVDVNTLVINSVKCAVDELEQLNVLYDYGLSDYIDLYKDLSDKHLNIDHVSKVSRSVTQLMKSEPKKFKYLGSMQFGLSINTQPVLKLNDDRVLDLTSLQILSPDELSDRYLHSNDMDGCGYYDPDYEVDPEIEAQFMRFYDMRLLRRLAYHLHTTGRYIDVIRITKSKGGKEGLISLLNYAVTGANHYTESRAVLSKYGNTYSQLTAPMTYCWIGFLDEVSEATDPPVYNKDGDTIVKVDLLGNRKLNGLTPKYFNIEIKHENPVKKMRTGTLAMIGAKYPHLDFRTKKTGQGINTRVLFCWSRNDDVEMRQSDFDALNTEAGLTYLANTLIKLAHDQLEYKAEHGVDALEYSFITPYDISSDFKVCWSNVAEDPDFAADLEINRKTMEELVKWSCKELDEMRDINEEDCRYDDEVPVLTEEQKGEMFN